MFSWKRKSGMPVSSGKAALAAALFIPWIAGCDVLNTAAPIWSWAYMTELLMGPVRSLAGTFTLAIVNTF